MTSSTQQRVRLSRADRREQLLDATRDIAHKDGFHAISIEAVARAAGITRPIVYDHFGGLDELLVALLERETARALEQFEALLAGGEPRLLESFEAYLEAVAGDPVTWSLVLMPPEGLPEVLRERIAQWRAVFARALAGAGGLRSPDPQLTGQSLQALADEGARLMLSDPQGFPRERLVAHARWLLAQLSG